MMIGHMVQISIPDGKFDFSKLKTREDPLFRRLQGCVGAHGRVLEQGDEGVKVQIDKDWIETVPDDCIHVLQPNEHGYSPCFVKSVSGVQDGIHDAAVRSAVTNMGCEHLLVDHRGRPLKDATDMFHRAWEAFACDSCSESQAEALICEEVNAAIKRNEE